MSRSSACWRRRDADLSSVLDLYAGSGALGIEALSRGAERCLFVESNRRVCRLLRDNLARAGRGRSRGGRDRPRWPLAAPPEGELFTLVLADPPYGDGGAWQAIERAIEGAVAPDALIAVEHAARGHAPAALCGCAVWRRRRQGDGAIAAYRCLAARDGQREEPQL